MEWRKFVFDWNRARAFLVTAEEGSFSAAARALGLAQPTLGRQVNGLEQELGVVLFERVGHRLELTATGRELADQVRTMAQAAARFSLIAAGQSQDVAGLVRIAASQAVSAFLLPPVLDALARVHPGLEIELVASNSASDLRRRESDIAVRHFRPKDSALVARKVRSSSKTYLYGTPGYLESLGRPESVDKLVERASVFGFGATDELLRVLNAAGYPFAPERISLNTSDHLVQWEFARRGMGLCIMMEEIGGAEPCVVRAPIDGPSIMSLPTWIVSHRELEHSRRIRVVFDALVDAFTDASHSSA